MRPAPPRRQLDCRCLSAEVKHQGLSLLSSSLSTNVEDLERAPESPPAVPPFPAPLSQAAASATCQCGLHLPTPTGDSGPFFTSLPWQHFPPSCLHGRLPCPRRGRHGSRAGVAVASCRLSNPEETCLFQSQQGPLVPKLSLHGPVPSRQNEPKTALHCRALCGTALEGLAPKQLPSIRACLLLSLVAEPSPKGEVLARKVSRSRGRSRASFGSGIFLYEPYVSQCM